MTVSRMLFLFALMGGIAGGCAQRTALRGDGASSQAEQFDPFDFGDEFADILGNQAAAGAPAVPDTGTGGIAPVTPQGMQGTITTPPSPPESRQGYRVQVGAFEEKDNADQVRRRVESLFDLPVYVEYQPPFYRVRAGNFTDQRDAEEFVRQFRERGFSDARWVPTIITIMEKE